MAEAPKRLHPLSPIFIAGATLGRVALPLLAFLFTGKRHEQWALWAGVPLTLVALWSIARALAFRYQVGERELLVRDGVFDRTERHIPFSRIHNVSQRRKLLHRVLGVTELHIESASGSKPEAVMKVLSSAEADALEALLRGAHGVAPAGAGAGADASASQRLAPSPVLLHLPLPEIVRFGLTSNHGVTLLAAAAGAIAQKDFLRAQFGAFISQLTHALGPQLRRALEAGHWSVVLFESLVALLIAFVLAELLSIVLAFFRFYNFTLTREGDKLIAAHGFGTQVRCAARLARLQRWELQQGWLHRRLDRCRLAVTVVGGGVHHGRGRGLEAGTQLRELAPIATWEQAQSLLRQCLPTLDWNALAWQRLDRAAVRRRLIGQARWVLPALAGLALVRGLPTEAPGQLALALGLAMLAAAMLWHARAWAAFAAYAEAGDVLVYRHGVWNRRWVIIVAARLHSLRLHSSPLDRSLGIVHLQADTQGGAKHARALDIACLGAAAAEALRARLWQRLQA
jgi:putative membrane protein